ncbi:exodeoxyribonuclease V subunit alpha [Pasteurellaceae bacterium RH1A]|nr:exodeoxyribonuclease V subunit alpha [Pasteurellaceae bacterium RH1A]
MLALLSDLKKDKVITEANYQFAKFIDQKQAAYPYSDTQKNLAVFLACLMHYQLMQGNTAMSLASCQKPFGDIMNRTFERDYYYEIFEKIGGFDPLVWQEELADHIAFSFDPKEKVAPILFQGDLIYFYRYWQAENSVANYLKQAAQKTDNLANPALNKAILDQIFTEAADEIDWQKIAVATALKQHFCLISGGPGTGKTRTVARLLAALQLRQHSQGLPLLNIALAAPTGKAAARLKESIQANLAELHQLPLEVQNALPVQASTLHRLLGIRPLSDEPKHHANNPLLFDLLVVDEASMIDLSLMEKLMAALKPSTRLVMLGDKDQLASVEAGAIMGELGQLLTYEYSQAHCDYLNQTTGSNLSPSYQGLPPICDCLSHLRKSYRFDEHSGIGKLADLINQQQAAKSWQVFANQNFADLALSEYPPATSFPDKHQWQEACVSLVVNKAVELYGTYLGLVKQRQQNPQAVSVEQIFASFKQVRFLSALREGGLGVEGLNESIAQALKQAHLVHFKHSREAYLGKPVLISENSPQLGIFNGDIGLILPDETGEKYVVYFDVKHEETGDYLKLSLSRLPAYDPAYVMTVHKSQGSEFGHTLLVMPLTSSPVLTKELLYTAVTRAKKRFSLFSQQNTWRSGVNQEIERQSGLNQQLMMDD